jgi:hypothetical protein
MHPPLDAIVEAPTGGLRTKPSLPGLTRQSIHLGKTFCKEDGCAGRKRVYALFDALLPAHDVSSGATANAVAHPAIVAD